MHYLPWRRWPSSVKLGRQGRSSMTIRNFKFLLKPRSVALIGASTKAGSVVSSPRAIYHRADFRVRSGWSIRNTAQSCAE